MLVWQQYRCCVDRDAVVGRGRAEVVSFADGAVTHSYLYIKIDINISGGVGERESRE
jgi:hypothetical protein